MGTLYDITAAWQNVIAAIETAEEGEDIAALIAEADSIESDWAAKTEAYAKVLLEMGCSVDGLTKEIARLEKRKKRLETACDALKTRMKVAMKALNLVTADTSIGRWRISKGREAVDIIDESKVPAQFLVTPAPHVSRTAIMDWYKETGEIAPGAEINRHETISFK